MVVVILLGIIEFSGRRFRIAHSRWRSIQCIIVSVVVIVVVMIVGIAIIVMLLLLLLLIVVVLAISRSEYAVDVDDLQRARHFEFVAREHLDEAVTHHCAVQCLCSFEARDIDELGVRVATRPARWLVFDERAARSEHAAVQEIEKVALR